MEKERKNSKTRRKTMAKYRKIMECNMATVWCKDIWHQCNTKTYNTHQADNGVTQERKEQVTYIKLTKEKKTDWVEGHTLLIGWCCGSLPSLFSAFWCMLSVFSFPLYHTIYCQSDVCCTCMPLLLHWCQMFCMYAVLSLHHTVAMLHSIFYMVFPVPGLGFHSGFV